jgi:hypothetical protein
MLQLLKGLVISLQFQGHLSTTIWTSERMDSCQRLF